MCSVVLAARIRGAAAAASAAALPHRAWTAASVGQVRAFGRKHPASGGWHTDSPFRYINPQQALKVKKKHYGEVLVTASRRKLLDTAQDVLNQPPQELPIAFWEVMSKRCIQSMHLFNALELAIIARLFDARCPKLKPGFDVFPAVVTQVRVLMGDSFPGLAVLVLSTVLPRRLTSRSELADLLQMLGRKAADAMWELSAWHAVAVLEAMTAAGVKDAPLCSRVAKKVEVEMRSPELLQVEDLSRAASVFAGQEHRDVDLMHQIADRMVELAPASPGGAEAASQVVQGFHSLGIDSVPELLGRVASRG